MNTLEILFFVLLFIVFYTYVGYGILLWILVKIKQSFISFYDTDEPEQETCRNGNNTDLPEITGPEGILVMDRRTTMPEALKKADEVLQQAVQGITDLINLPALINLDFADVQTVMTDKGIAHIGIGTARGDDKALEAVKQAITSPLLETTIAGASHVIINVSGDISLIDANEAASYVQEQVGEDANVIFGAMYDSTNSDEVSITVIATGLQDNANKSVLPNYRPVTQKAPQPTAAASTATQNPVKPEFKTKPVQPLPGLKTFKKPESTIEEQEIKIPQFFQKNR